MEIELLESYSHLAAGKNTVTYVASAEGAVLCRDKQGRPLYLPRISFSTVRVFYADGTVLFSRANMPGQSASASESTHTKDRAALLCRDATGGR